ncbi:MAG: MaoC family dehydratase [Alphaproteobacteria bacterium]|nr:MaoC family dehydratase [Alphaproteobacteria bacterium]
MKLTVSTGKTFYFEDLELGMEATVSTTVTMDDIETFASVSGDYNPVHLDREYAAQTIFKQPIAHGLLTASYISTVFGMKMPGPGAIYVSQSLNFKAPVLVGDEVVARVVVADLMPAKRRARFDCFCTVKGKIVLDGEANMMVPARPKSD